MLEIWTEKSGFNLGTYQERSKVNILLPVVRRIVASISIQQDRLAIRNDAFDSLPPNPIIDYQIPNSDISVNVSWRKRPRKILKNAPVINTISNTTSHIDSKYIDSDFEYYEPIITVINGGELHTPGGEFNSGEKLFVPFLDLGIAFDENWFWYVNTVRDPEVTYSIISGKLPPGLRLKDNNIIGVPLEVAKETVFEFCIRASSNGDFSDRTYKITIQGSNLPVIINPEGALPIGPNSTYFILDSSPVDFQLTVTDFDVAAGQQLRFFISSGDGTLPLGLTMDSHGRITGFIQPLLAIPLSQRNGNYDKNIYDIHGFDYGIKSDNGFDSYNFDAINYDYSLTSIGPKKLNRNYEFILSVSDGDNLVKRKFRIFVVGDDFLRADNTLMNAGNGTYTAAGSGVRAPIWFTEPNLGTIRANNYHIIKLDIYEAIETGFVSYRLEEFNPDQSESILPPGLQLDIINGELYGSIPYQPSITETYNFTVTASRYGLKGEVAPSKRTFTVRLLGEVNSTMSWISPERLGSIDANYISTLKVQATSTLPDAEIIYELISGELPPGLVLDKKGELVGKVQQYGDNDLIKGIITFDNNRFSMDNNETILDRRYKFVIRAQDQVHYSAIDKEFVIAVNTPNDRLYSNIFITSYLDPLTPTPETSKRAVYEKFIKDETIFTRDYIYRIDDPNFGVQQNLRTLIYAGIETKLAGPYISAMGTNNKRKRFQFGAVKIAQAKVPGTETHVYDVVYVELVDALDIQNKKLPIKLKNLSKMSGTITADTSNKIWKDPYATNNEPFLPRPNNIITVDQTSILSSDPNGRIRYTNDYLTWRDRLKNWKNTDPLNPNTILDQFATERNYLPLWMRSFQDDTRQELGFVLALPLCYCLPGYGKEIVLNIKNSNFDFKLLDFTVDRYIIDSVIPRQGERNYGDKYLIFKNNEVTL
jgi:hypothetical protein